MIRLYTPKTKNEKMKELRRYGKIIWKYDYEFENGYYTEFGIEHEKRVWCLLMKNGQTLECMDITKEMEVTA